MKQCPICPDAQLQRIRYEGFALLMCSSCGGALVDDPDIKGIERKMEIREDQLVPQAAVSNSPNSPDNAGILHCPRCLNDMTKAPALEELPASLKSTTIEDFYIDHCKNCRLTWFDGGELAKLQLSYERSAKGQENKQHYENYLELNAAEQAKYRRTMAESVYSSGDALSKGFFESLAEMAKRISRRYHR